MNLKSKMYSFDQVQQQQKQKIVESKPQRNMAHQADSSNGFRTSGGSRACNINRQKISRSIVNPNEQKRNISPSLSNVTHNQEYFREMQHSILSQNQNLKEHNIFLRNQIEVMFGRERKFKKTLQINKQKIKQLQSLNICLQEQFQVLINNILTQIERIQNLIEEQKRCENIHQENYKKSVLCASETQSTINKDLEDLKIKVKDIYMKNFQVQEEGPVFHRSSYKANSLSRYISPSEEDKKQIKRTHRNQISQNIDSMFPDYQLPVSLIKSKNSSERNSKVHSRIQ